MLRFQPDRKYVLIENGKHGRVTHSATTPEEFAASCYAILKERVEQGWYDEWPVPDFPKDWPGRDEAAALPDGALKNMALQKIKDFESRVRTARANNELVERAKRIVSEPDKGPIAKHRRSNEQLLGYQCEAGDVLAQRSGYEYERVDLEQLIVPT